MGHIFSCRVVVHFLQKNQQLSEKKSISETLKRSARQPVSERYTVPRRRRMRFFACFLTTTRRLFATTTTKKRLIRKRLRPSAEPARDELARPRRRFGRKNRPKKRLVRPHKPDNLLFQLFAEAGPVRRALWRRAIRRRHDRSRRDSAVR